MNLVNLPIQEWVHLCHRDAMEAGWWDGCDRTDPTTAAVKIALVHSELSEALEGIRTGAMDSHIPTRRAIEVELADTFIRICDLAGALELDLEGAMIEKRAYNQRRPDHQTAARRAAGGKKF